MRHVNWLGFNRAPDALNVGPGAAAHMSLHLDQQCQRAQKPDAFGFPLLEGDRGAWFSVTEAADRVARRCGDGAYMGRVGERQTLFCVFLTVGSGSL